MVSQRDDLSIELCSLYNQTGQHEAALKILTSRHFQPWEGGEGLCLASTSARILPWDAKCSPMAILLALANISKRH